MKAVGIDAYGGPEVLHVHERPQPHAGPGEIRLRVHAAAVNPADTLVRVGAAHGALQGPPPYIPGLDAAGIVDEIAEGTVTALKIGDRAMAMVSPIRPAGGAYAQWVVLPAHHVVKAPAGHSHAEASTLPMNGLTARLALDELALGPGRTLAVTGAAGAVGGYAVQLAKADGLTVVADASPADERLVSSLGADAVVRRGAGVAERFRAFAPDGVDGLVDAAAIGAPLLRAITDGGAFAVLRRPEGYGTGPVEADRGIAVKDVYVHAYEGRHDKLEELRRQVESGALSLRVARSYPMEQAAEAHRALERGGIRGRLVLEF